MANKKISELTTRTPSLSDLMLVGDPSSGYSFKCTVTALATIIETDIADGYVTLGTAQTISGAKTFSNNLTLTSVSNAGVDTDKFLVLSGSNVVNFRTGAEVLSDIGAQAALTNPITGTGTSGQVAYFNGTNSITSSPTFAFTPTSQLLVNNSVTAASAIARGINATPTLTAAANNDVLVGLDITPTFNNGAFINVNNFAARINGILAGVTGYYSTGASANTHFMEIVSTTVTNGYVNFRRTGGSNGPAAYQLYQGLGIFEANTNTGITTVGSNLYQLNFLANNTVGMAVFAATRNVLIQNGGTFTDAGFRLDVNGTARVQGNTTILGGSLTVNNTSVGVITGGSDVNSRPMQFQNDGTSGNWGGGYTFRSGHNASAGVIMMRLFSNGPTSSTNAVGIGAYTEGALQNNNIKLAVFDRASGSGATLPNYSDGISINSAAGANYNYTNTKILGLTIGEPGTGGQVVVATTTPNYSVNIGFQRHPLDNGWGSSMIMSAKDDAGTMNEIMRVMGRNQSVGIGVTQTTNLGTKLQVGGSVTAASSLAQGVFVNNTLVAAANNDVLVGLDINPTFTNGAFTGVTNYVLRGIGANGANVILGGGQANSGTSTINIYGTNRLDRAGFISAVASGSFSNNSINFGLNHFDGTTLFTDNYITIAARQTILNFASLSNNPYIYPTTTNTNSSLQFSNSTITTVRGAAIYAIAQGINAVTSRLDFAISNATNPVVATSDVAMSLFNSKNLGINTTTDAGFRLDVNGTARVQAFLQINSSTRADFVLRTGGSNNNSFTVYAIGGAFGSNYAQFGTNDGENSGSQGGAIYTDSRTGVAPPIRLMVKGTGTTTMTNAMSVFNTANIAINTSTDAGFRLDIAGTARVQGATTISGSVNSTATNQYFNTWQGTQNVSGIAAFGTTVHTYFNPTISSSSTNLRPVALSVVPTFSGTIDTKVAVFASTSGSAAVTLGANAAFLASSSETNAVGLLSSVSGTNSSGVMISSTPTIGLNITSNPTIAIRINSVSTTGAFTPFETIQLLSGTPTASRYIVRNTTASNSTVISTFDFINSSTSSTGGALGNNAGIQLRLGISNPTFQERYTSIAAIAPNQTSLPDVVDLRFQVSNASGTTTNALYLSSQGHTLTTFDNTTGLTISGSSLTGSNAQSLVSLSQTWNTTGNPTAIKLDVTNTASGANSYLLDLQVGGIPQFTVFKGGEIKTSSPAGGVAQTWKLGSVQGVTPTSPNRTIEVEVNGTTYYLHAKTTND